MSSIMSSAIVICRPNGLINRAAPELSGASEVSVARLRFNGCSAAHALNRLSVFISPARRMENSRGSIRGLAGGARRIVGIPLTRCSDQRY